MTVIDDITREMYTFAVVYKLVNLHQSMLNRQLLNWKWCFLNKTWPFSACCQEKGMER